METAWKIICGHRRWAGCALLLIFLGTVYYFLLPEPLFSTPYSNVIESNDGQLLSAGIAGDGQWRFPLSDNTPEKFKDALVAFEDKRFFNHCGVDILSLGNAFVQNIKAGQIVRGGSTISMQVIRLARRGKPRTVIEKLYEILLATRLELRYTKSEILDLYSAHAPFGGNVLGVQTACWRYFGRTGKDLSWGEAALLAVLPNAPALIHPGRNRESLLRKRNALLDRLKGLGKMDAFTCDLAKQEDIPAEPVSLPRHAPHLLTRAAKEGKTKEKLVTTIDLSVQLQVEEILERYHQQFKGNQIHNVCAIVAKVSSGEVLAYAGNVASSTEGQDVDIVMAPRSTGSILKPMLYAASIDEGKILQKTLLPDIPTYLNGFTPKNFSHQYDGAVPADEALIRSLNVPAVFLLKEYRYERFHALLKNLGMTTLNKSPDHYGLSLILGGAEGNLWDITGIYASMARTLNNYFQHPGRNKYNRKDFHPLTYTSIRGNDYTLSETSWLSASAIYQTFDVMKELYRPGEETGWRHFESSQNIAWKTGTSFGFRDGWAVGVTPQYVVGVWVGNADGEGRPGLTGVDAAAPVMFEIFSQLDDHTWFRRPFMEMQTVTTCRLSGMRSTAFCDQVDSVFVAPNALAARACNYHRRIHLSEDGKSQVSSKCMDVSKMIAANWFVLPPVQEHYYKVRNLSYKALPPFAPGCTAAERIRTMDLVYPKPGSRLFIPRNVRGEAGSAIFQLAHRDPKATVYWYLNGEYLGETHSSHHFAVNPPSGQHILTLVDHEGNTIDEPFQVLSQL